MFERSELELCAIHSNINIAINFIQFNLLHCYVSVTYNCKVRNDLQSES